MKIYEKNDDKVLLGYADDQAKLELKNIGKNLIKKKKTKNFRNNIDKIFVNKKKKTNDAHNINN